MVHDGVNWRTRTQRLALAAAVLPLAAFGGSAVHAQSIMRTPTLHIDSRVTTINPTVTPRVNPNIAGRNSVTISRPNVTVNTIARTPAPHVSVTTSVVRTSIPRIGVLSTLPHVRYSPNLYPVCDYANVGPDGECFDRPVIPA